MLHIDTNDAAILVEHEPWWLLGLALSTITAISFIAIGIVLIRGLFNTDNWKGNPLALGTGLIFLTCGGGHLIHSLQLLWPFFGASAIGTAARIHYMDWHLWAVDGFTAAAGVWYWMQRRRFPQLVAATAMYEDLQASRRVALELNDSVVQDMNAARMALEQGDVPRAQELLRRAEDA